MTLIKFYLILLKIIIIKFKIYRNIPKNPCFLNLESFYDNNNIIAEEKKKQYSFRPSYINEHLKKIT